MRHALPRYGHSHPRVGLPAHPWRTACLLAGLTLGTLSWSRNALAQATTIPGPREPKSTTLKTNDRVRLRLHRAGLFGARTIEGRLIELRRDSVQVVSDEGAISTVAVAEVQRIDVSVGERRLFLESTGVGTALGMSFGALVGYLSHEESPTTLSWDRETTAMGGAVLGASLGLVFGAFVGLSITTDRWERIVSPGLVQRLAIGAAPGTPRSLAVRVRF